MHTNCFCFRHVSLPKVIARYVPNELMTEEEWRSLGVKQSQGWEHYMIHGKTSWCEVASAGSCAARNLIDQTLSFILAPEPHVLLFKREKDYQAKYLNGPKQA